MTTSEMELPPEAEAVLHKIADILTPLIPQRDYRKELWIKQFVAIDECADVAAVVADQALAEFDKRFPS